MNVGIDGGAAKGAGHGTGDPGRPEAERAVREERAAGEEGKERGGDTRRGVLRGVFASAVTAALTPLVTASSRPAPAQASGQSSHPASGRAAAPRTRRPPESPAHRQDTEYPHAPAYARDLAFDEMYRGRRIIGFRTLAGRDAGEWYVAVDGRPLHLMRRDDGTWLTMVDHYRSYATPLEAARGAVDEMPPGSRLRDTGHGPWREEGHHGVHP